MLTYHWSSCFTIAFAIADLPKVTSRIVFRSGCSYSAYQNENNAHRLGP